MTKIKVAHVLHCVGGVDVSLRLILENIDHTDFESIVLHGKQDVTKLLQDNVGNPIKNYPLSIVRDISPFKDVSAILQTIKILRRERPDIIHAHSAKGGIIGRIAGKLLGVKVLYTPQAFSYLSAQRPIPRKIYMTIEKWFANGNTVLLASSRSEQNRAIREVGFKQENTMLFNNSVLPISSIKSLSIPKSWPDEYICTVGRPSYQKNIELMLDVISYIKAHRPIHLVLMGVGHHSGQLESVKEKVIALGLSENVTMLDWTCRDDVFNIISHSQLYISTARYEGLPYSIIESLALSIPCVVSDCDGNRDLIHDGYNGFVIASGKPQDYGDKIMSLLSDRKLFEALSENAKKMFLEGFDMTANIKKLEAIYRDNAKA